jgi:hypothetical protein
LFTPEKYIVVHFTKAQTKCNTTYPFTLTSFTISSSPSAHILVDILNKKLSWQPHLQHIKSKLATQTNVLKRLTASTWGASLQVLRLLYTTVVGPAIEIGYPAWWAPLAGHSFDMRLEKSFRKPNTDASEPSPEPTRPHRYSASMQKWECPRFLST